MEPSGGLPPDRDNRQLVLRAQTSPQQQQLVPLQQVKPALSLNLPQHQHALSTIAASPATALALAGPNASTSGALTSSTGAIVATTTALVVATSSVHNTTAVSSGSNNNASSTSPVPAAATTTTTSVTSGAGGISTQPHSHSQHHHQHQHQHQHQHPPHIHTTHPPHQHQHHSSSQHGHNASSATSSLLGGLSSSSSSSSGQQQTIEKLSRPMAFDKMEALVREMQDPENGVPVRQQKMFLTSIPYAFMGYDLIEWLMDRLLIEESEALNIANQLCLHGYFFPVNDTKTLTVKDDSSLYRFQTPYYWPWQHKAPDNVEYAIYLAKRSLRNKQRHALEDYEAEALASLHKNLKGKWDFISMQAEEQVRLAKERKKGDKIVGDSQERAYWRVHRPPPGQFTPLEPCPIPSRDRQGVKPNKKKTIEDVQREVDYLKKSLNRTRMKMSQACESLVNYSETFAEYDFFLQPVLPSNPWVTDDITFWQLNNTFVDIPTEKRVKRWAISIEELVSDPTGLQEFTTFLEKEYSHENIRFWIAVNRLRRSAHSQVARKVNEIYEEFLKPGAPCEINIDGKTMESVLKGLKNPSRFTFDAASEHIYMLLLKKDCYPRFIRSDHYKRLLETGIQPSHKKRFFNFGGVSGAKKKMTAALSSQPNLGETVMGSKASGSAAMMQAPPPGSLARRRGSDRSLTGSAHELAVIGVNKDITSKVPHSHSQSNLSEIPYSSESIYRGDMPPRHMDAGIYGAYGNRESSLHTYQETPKPKATRLETTIESSGSAVCPWDVPDEPPAVQAPSPAAPPPATAVAASKVKLSVCPWEQEAGSDTKSNSQRLTSTSSDITDVSDRMQRNLGIRHQNTVDSGEAGIKRLIPNFTEQRRASVSFTPGRISEYSYGQPSASAKTSSTPSPTVGSQSVADTHHRIPPMSLPLFSSLQAQNVAAIAAVTAISGGTAAATATAAHAGSVITKDPPSSSDAEVEEELHKLSISERTCESSTSELSALPPPTPTPSLLTKITPPPPPDNSCAEAATQIAGVEDTVLESPQSELLGETKSGGESGGGSAASACSGAESETEVEIFVQEVQIELIETVDILEGNRSKLTTPTIQVEEEDECDESETVDSVEPECECQASVSPTCVRSAPPSPEREIKSTIAPPEVMAQPYAPRLFFSASTHPVPSTSMLPPPLPPIGPMEEEEQLKEEENAGVQEELSPTTDEYQEGLQFGGDSKDDYEYDIVDTDTQVGYIAPAPTPAPSMAPLAELDVDTVDDEPCEEMKPTTVTGTSTTPLVTPTSITPTAAVETSAHHHSGADDTKRRRKKRNSDGKKMTSLEDKEKASTSAAGGESGAKAAEADRNTVCPWEDENVTTSDGTFVKTYATLGYL